MASLIEREAVKPDERPKIASVFYNRLKADMPVADRPDRPVGAGYPQGR